MTRQCRDARDRCPFEFRLFAYRPRPWTPQDSLVVGMATVLDLTDDWDDIAPRDAAYRRGGARLRSSFFRSPTPATTRRFSRGFRFDRCRDRVKRAVGIATASDDRSPHPVGSNEWAAGAAYTNYGHALFANDPHLGFGNARRLVSSSICARPVVHVAGATLPGFRASCSVTTSASLGAQPRYGDVAFSISRARAADSGGVANGTARGPLRRPITMHCYRWRDVFFGSPRPTADSCWCDGARMRIPTRPRRRSSRSIERAPSNREKRFCRGIPARHRTSHSPIPAGALHISWRERSPDNPVRGRWFRFTRRLGARVSDNSLRAVA